MTERKDEVSKYPDIDNTNQNTQKSKISAETSSIQTKISAETSSIQTKISAEASSIQTKISAEASSIQTKRESTSDDERSKRIFKYINEIADDYEENEKKEILSKLLIDIDYFSKAAKNTKAEITSLEKDAFQNMLFYKQHESLSNNEEFGETFLHVAVRRFQAFRNKTEARGRVEAKVMKKLFKTFPKLVLCRRELLVGRSGYEGQSPLHMAAVKGNLWFLGYVLEKFVPSDASKHTPARRKAMVERLQTKLFNCVSIPGKCFKDSIMEAELLLSITALRNDKESFRCIRNHGAKVEEVNSKGDNVCHSLIRYAQACPNELEDILDMCQFLLRQDIDNPIPLGIWLACNNGTTSQHGCFQRQVPLDTVCNPLTLAAFLGQHDIFDLLLKKLYRRSLPSEGPADTHVAHVYDITDFDAVSWSSESQICSIPEPLWGKQITATEILKDQKTPEASKMVKGSLAESEKMTKPLKSNSESSNCTNAHRSPMRPPSILELLNEHDSDVMFKFLELNPIPCIIKQKWKIYRLPFYIWFSYHIIFMCLLTWCAVERAELKNQNLSPVVGSSNLANTIPEDPFVTSFGVISVIMAVIYVIMEVAIVVKGRLRWFPLLQDSSENASDSKTRSIKIFGHVLRLLLHPYRNLGFRLLVLLFSLCLIIDIIAPDTSQYYENYLLMVAVVLGWFLFLFFARSLQIFSFVSVLFLQALVKDIFRFSVLLVVELLALSTCFYMVLQGSNDAGHIIGFDQLLYTNFITFVGLSDVDNLHETRKPVVAVMVYLGHVIFTRILLFNLLIAVISRTSIELANGKHSKRLIRQAHLLSIILFIFIPSQFLALNKQDIDIDKDFFQLVQPKEKRKSRELLIIRSKLEGDTSDKSWGTYRSYETLLLDVSEDCIVSDARGKGKTEQKCCLCKMSV